MKQLHTHRAPHNVTQLYVHLVFVTKARNKYLAPSKEQTYRALFIDICKRIGSKLVANPRRAARLCELVEFGLEEDHVHLLVRYPPRLSISDLVQYLKGLSSHEWPDRGTAAGPNLKARYGDEPLWGSSYFAKSVGHKSIAETAEYERNQGANKKAKSATPSLPATGQSTILQ